MSIIYGDKLATPSITCLGGSQAKGSKATNVTIHGATVVPKGRNHVGLHLQSLKSFGKRKKKHQENILYQNSSLGKVQEAHTHIPEYL
mgnify:CR=1 FL=1